MQCRGFQGLAGRAVEVVMEGGKGEGCWGGEGRTLASATNLLSSAAEDPPGSGVRTARCGRPCAAAPIATGQQGGRSAHGCHYTGGCTHAEGAAQPSHGVRTYRANYTGVHLKPISGIFRAVFVCVRNIVHGSADLKNYRY